MSPGCERASSPVIRALAGTHFRLGPWLRRVLTSGSSQPSSSSRGPFSDQASCLALWNRHPNSVGAHPKTILWSNQPTSIQTTELEHRSYRHANAFQHPANVPQLLATDHVQRQPRPIPPPYTSSRTAAVPLDSRKPRPNHQNPTQTVLLSYPILDSPRPIKCSAGSRPWTPIFSNTSSTSSSRTAR